MTTPRTFAEMTDSQLRQFINGCHSRRDYDEQFRAATRVLNEREDARFVPNYDGAFFHDAASGLCDWFAAE